MKNKINRRKYFVGNKKLKHVKLFENFDVNEKSGDLLNKLPIAVKTVEDAERLLIVLALEGKFYHFDDDPADLVGDPFTKEEAQKVDKLINQAFDVCEKKWGNQGFWEGLIKDVFLGYVAFGASDDTIYIVHGNGGSGNVKKATKAQYEEARKMLDDKVSGNEIATWYKKLTKCVAIFEATEDGLNNEIRSILNQFGSKVEDYIGEFTVASDLTVSTFAAEPLKLKEGDKIKIAEGKMPLYFSVRHPRGISEVKMTDVMNAIEMGEIYNEDAMI